MLRIPRKEQWRTNGLEKCGIYYKLEIVKGSLAKSLLGLGMAIRSFGRIANKGGCPEVKKMEQKEISEDFRHKVSKWEAKGVFDKIAEKIDEMLC